MILAFLIVLGVLGYAVLGELERREQRPEIRRGCCGGCGQAVAHDWLVCPSCHNLLRRRCGGCRKMVSTLFAFCPHCGEKREVAA
jgi:RNA polymerase subunit RPABC4/transcription elongation factor Spt4